MSLKEVKNIVKASGTYDNMILVLDDNDKHDFSYYLPDHDIIIYDYELLGYKDDKYFLKNLLDNTIEIVDFNKLQELYLSEKDIKGISTSISSNKIDRILLRRNIKEFDFEKYELKLNICKSLYNFLHDYNCNFENSSLICNFA